MRLSLKLLLLTTFTSMILTQCSNNCASCGVLEGAEYCFVCQNSAWADGGKCSGTIPANCLYHSTAGCMTCNEGFILNKDDNSCVAAGDNAIQNCLVQWSQTNDDKSVSYGCNVCKGSAPSVDQTQCNRDMPANCDMGGINNMDLATCVKCSNNGQISVNGQCVGSFSVGCILANDRGQCIQCATGYFMKFSGVCAKDPPSLDEEEVIKVDI